MSIVLALILFAFSALATPGPNTLMIMLSSIRFGMKKTFAHYFGVCCGFPIMVIILGMGLKEVFTAYPVIHSIVKYVGAVYMLYLAWKIMRASSQIKEIEVGGKSLKPMSFLQAVLFQWANPKAWVIAITAISTYTTIGGSLYGQILLMALIFFVVNIPSLGVWYIGGRVIKKLIKNEKALQYFCVTMGVLLILSIVINFI